VRGRVFLRAVGAICISVTCLLTAATAGYAAPSPAARARALPQGHVQLVQRRSGLLGRTRLDAATGWGTPNVGQLFRGIAAMPSIS
jgi:hypothetical protein